MNDSPIETLKEIVGDLQQLIRAEFALAQSEVTTKLSHIASASALLLIGTLMAMAALPIFLLGVAAMIAIWLPVWASLLIVAAVVLVGGGVAIRVGLQRISNVQAIPERTVANLKKDAEVIREHV